MTRPFASDKVAAAFEAVAPSAREGMMALRSLVLETADQLPQIGRVEEALRWGQPAYLTPDTKSGTTLRLGVAKSGKFALFVHCQTSLIADFSLMFPGQDRIEGARAILFGSTMDIDPLRHGWLIRRALTYHVKPA
jgi:hypothetical protein